MPVDFEHIPKNRIPTKQHIGKKIYNRFHGDKHFTIMDVLEKENATYIDCKDTDQKWYTFFQENCKLVK